MEKLHLEIFNPKRKEIFDKLSAFREKGYLAGGTALALQLGHRISYDFDIFCLDEISDRFPEKVREILDINKVSINNSDEFTFFTENDIKISFVFYPFILKKYVLEFNDCPLKIISPLGVALTKAYAMNRRNAWRDYVDLYIILKNKLINLENIIKEAKDVYGELFNEKLFLAQLLYTEDISETEIMNTPMIEDEVSLDEVVDFFKKEIDAYSVNKLKN